MTRKVAIRCLNCFTIADEVCECGKVASSPSLLGEHIPYVFADSYLDYEIVYVWLNEEGGISYIYPYSGFLPSKKINIDISCKEPQ
jgi:hypothetical protein